MLRMVPHAKSCKGIKVTFSSLIWTCQITKEERKVLTANCYSFFCLKDCAWVANRYTLMVGRREIYATNSRGEWLAFCHTMEKIEKVQESSSEVFLKQTLHYAIFWEMKLYNSEIYISYSLCGLNWNVSALSPNKHFFWTLSPNLVQYMQTSREPRDLLTSSQFLHCQMRYSAEGWSFSSGVVNSVMLKPDIPCCHRFIFGHRALS